MTNSGTYGTRLVTAAERYGRHSQAHATGPSAVQLVQQAIAAGEAIRLAWRDEESTGPADASHEFPTAVLPVIDHQEPADDGAGDASEPNTTTSDAHQRLPPGDFSWWPIRLAG